MGHIPPESRLKAARRRAPVEITANLSGETLVGELRRVLYRLYDPGVLRNSPLVDLFKVDRERSSSELQKILIEAIEALEPDASVSPQSDAARTHSILTHRFVDQFSQMEVAATLGLSIRQMQRDESIALRALADHLVTRYDLRLTSSKHGSEPSPASESPFSDLGASSHESELRWLDTSYPSQAIQVRDLVQPVLDLASPLMQTLGVCVECTIDGDLPHLAVQQISLRQALLNVLTAAMRAVPGGRVEIRVEAQGKQVCISILPIGQCAAAGPSQDIGDSLAMARELVRLSGGSLCVLGDDNGKSWPGTRFVLPMVEQVVVFAIDDNADTLQLLQRYLAGTRYPFVGIRDPQQALALVEGLAPKIILLDVMLPGVDGWELLGRLREHPRLRGVPIVVCTILPMEQFALILGAAAFIHKPVSREALLAVLDRLSALPLPESS